MVHSRGRFVSCVAALLGALLWMAACEHLAHAEGAASGIEIAGEATWCATYAAGDSVGLEGMTGYTVDTLILSQTLRVSLSGELPGGFSASASLDNHGSGNLQLVRVDLGNERVSGHMGDFVYSTVNPYVTRRLTLRGLQINARLDGDIELGAVVGRVKGVPASKTFRGASSTDTTVFIHGGPYCPTRDGSVLVASMSGAESYHMTGEFDPDFMKVQLRYDNEAGARRSLFELLAGYGMEYLYRGAGSGGGVLAEGDLRGMSGESYVVCRSADGDHLILRRESLDILRGEIRDLIDEYNEENDLSGGDRKEYPFVVGSDSEDSFLRELRDDHVRVIAGSTDDPAMVLDRPASECSTGRFYVLGCENIAIGSVIVTVLTNGVLVDGAALPGLSWTVFLEQGVMELSFPAGAPGSYEEIRVTYDYSVSANLYTLGIAVTWGSELVYLNGELLTRDIDYAIDYDAGILVMLREVGPEDTLTVEYEYFAGGILAPVEYKRVFYGGSLTWRPMLPMSDVSVTFDVIRAQDGPEPLVGEDSARTMPNTHTVVGISMDAEVGALTLDMDAAYSHDVFPHDDNRRRNRANEINDVLYVTDDAGTGYVLFAHQNGLTAFSGDRWRHYSVGAGLAGWSVRDIASSPDRWYFATGSGLTVLSPEAGPGGDPPFDRVGNWRRYYDSDGLPSSSTLSVLVTGGEVWVGTDAGLARTSEHDLESWRVYNRSSNPEMASEVANDIAASELTQALYVATPDGLMSFDGWAFTTEFEGVAVHEVACVLSGGEGLVFAATDSGVRFRRELGGPWQVVPGTDGRRWNAARAIGGLLWLAGEDGLYMCSALDGTAPPILIEDTAGRAVSAVGGVGDFLPDHADGIWAGERADDLYRIALWSSTPPYVHFVEHVGEDIGIAGEDDHRYSDVAAGEHTHAGFAGALSAAVDLRAARLYGSYERVEPGFLALGARGRRDIAQLRVGGTVTVAERVNVRAEHAVSTTRAADLDADPTWPVVVATDTAELSWNIGPHVDVAYTVDRIDDTAPGGADGRRVTYSVAVQQALFEQRLSLRLGYESSAYEDSADVASSYTAQDLRGDVTLRPIEDLTLKLYYRSPIRTYGIGTLTVAERGSRDAGASARWDARVGSARVVLELVQDSRTDVPSNLVRLQRRASARATMPALRLGDLGVTPSGGIAWNYLQPPVGEARTSASADAFFRGTLGPWRADLRVKAARTKYHESDKIAVDREVAVSVANAGLGRPSPSGEAGWKASTRVHPSLGEQTTESASAVARLSWTLARNGTDTVSVWYSVKQSWEDDFVTYGAGNVLRQPVRDGLMATLSGTIERTLGVKEGADCDDTRGKLELGTDWMPSDTWRVSVSLGCIRGSDSVEGEQYTTHTATAKVTASF